MYGFNCVYKEFGHRIESEERFCDSSRYRTEVVAIAAGQEYEDVR